MRSYLAVVKNELTQLFRDPWQMALLTIGAVATLIAMTYTMSSDLENVPLVVVDGDGGAYSRKLIDHLLADDFFEPGFSDSQEEAEELVRLGRASAAVVIPGGFSRDVYLGNHAGFLAIVDGSDPNTAEYASSHIKAIASYLHYEVMLRGRGAGLSPARPQARLRYRYNPDMRGIHSMVPGLIGVVLTVSAIGAAMCLARERERGNLELLFGTPIGTFPMLMGRVTPYIFIGLADTAFFTLLGTLLFGVPFKGPIFDFFLLGTCYLLAIMGLGLLMGQLIHSQHGAMVASFMLLGIPPIYMSDIVFSIDGMPAWLQQQAYLLPATHFTIAARGVMLKGIGIETLWPHGLYMLAFGVVTNAVALLLFKNKL